jgi:hypothetical protein
MHIKLYVPAAMVLTFKQSKKIKIKIKKVLTFKIWKEMEKRVMYMSTLLPHKHLFILLRDC